MIRKGKEKRQEMNDRERLMAEKEEGKEKTNKADGTGEAVKKKLANIYREK